MDITDDTLASAVRKLVESSGRLPPGNELAP